MEHFDTIVIGAGQAGLATGYYLKQRGRDFVILDGGARVGDAWRKRWDTLRLFTPAEYNGLPGMPFPASAGHLPLKDEVADYFEHYAAHVGLPIRLGTWVESLARAGERYVVRAGEHRFGARHVVVATGAYQKQRVPAFASGLDPAIRQLPSTAYRNPAQLPAGDVLVVGAGNTGAQIALDLASAHRVWLSGRPTGHMPRRLLGMDIFWWLWRTLLRVPVHTRLGQRLRAKMGGKGAPLVGISEERLSEAGITRVPRTEGVRNGRPLLADGRALDVAAIVWATGFTPDFSWIALDVLDARGYPRHERGVVEGAPGLYVVGLPFLYRGNSSLIGGVEADAAYIVAHLATRAARERPAPTAETGAPAREISVP